MAVVFDGISLRSLTDHGDILQRTEAVLRLEVVTEKEEPVVTIYNGEMGGFSGLVSVTHRRLSRPHVETKCSAGPRDAACSERCAFFSQRAAGTDAA